MAAAAASTRARAPTFSIRRIERMLGNGSINFSIVSKRYVTSGAGIEGDYSGQTLAGSLSKMWTEFERQRALSTTPTTANARSPAANRTAGRKTASTTNRRKAVAAK